MSANEFLNITRTETCARTIYVKECKKKKNNKVVRDDRTKAHGRLKNNRQRDELYVVAGA